METPPPNATTSPTIDQTGDSMSDASQRGRIEVKGLTKRFSDFTAVEDLTFSVEPGRVTGFLGPNGAGKTTTLRMLLHLISPSAGTATIDGLPYRQLTRPLETVGAALEATNFHPGRSGRDHLRVMAATHGIATSRVDELLELTGIPAAARKRAGAYSMGMRQRLALAATLLGDPHVLLLDEPSNGLDPEGIRWLRGFLRHLAHEQGKTVLVSSHLLREMEQTADDIVIIANGQLIQQGTVADLRGEPSALVRTSDPSALARVLTESGLDPDAVGVDSLRVATDDLRVVGDAALRAGVPIWELRSEQADLEALFFQLTEGTNRNLGTDRAGGVA